MNDKIKDLEELVATEKDARTVWIDNYEKEQKSHVKTNAELLRVRSLHQTSDMELKSEVVNK